MTSHRKVTIVILSYNSRHKLPDCLESVFNSNYPKNLYKVVVIDNDSSDSSAGYVRERFPQVKLIVNRKNIGFDAGNNQGYFLAQKHKSDYLVLLNDDTIVETNWLRRMIYLAESKKKIAIVQAKLLLHPEKSLINSFGNKIHFLGFGYCDKYREENNNRDTTPIEIAYASGGACAIKMSALKKTGLFDDKMFMYHEDLDLGWRMRLAGYSIMLDPLAVVYHKYNYSKAKYKFYYMDRNRWIVLLENYRLATLILILPPLLVMELGIILFSIKNKWFKEKMRGWGWILLHLPHIIRRRREEQKIRKVKDRDIIKFFTGSISYQEIDSPILKFVVNPLMEIYLWILKMIVVW